MRPETEGGKLANRIGERVQEGRKGEEEERYERKPKINRKTWNEFGKNDKGELRMILVEDWGVSAM